jgi:hypothetical protein
MSDPRAARAREAHRLSKVADVLAARHRDQRNHLVRVLRTEDPKRWTYTALAVAVGITPELVAAIIQRRA